MRSHRIVLGVLALTLGIGTVSEAKTTATVTCTDGTTSKAGRGVCSHHGGVASAGSAATAPAIAGNEAKAAAGKRSSAPAAGANAGDASGATAKCKDGTYSRSTHNGACAHHGGVAQWLDGSGQ
jgi:hypothetical protein